MRRGACPLLAQSGHLYLHSHMSAFGGKADMTFCSAMSANDPKRTSADVPSDSFQGATLSRYNPCLKP